MSFIVIEGCDRVGKSAQVALLTDKLFNLGYRVKTFAFPCYESDTGKIILQFLHNKIALANYVGEATLSPGRPVSSYEALVFQCVQTCDKYAVAGQIINAIRQGYTVVCGRWWQSAFIYGKDDGINPKWLMDVHAFLPQADLNILLDLSPVEAIGRVVVPGDRYDRDLDKQLRLRDSYLSLWAEHSHQPGWKVLSSEGTIDEVHRRIIKYVRKNT